MGQLDAYLTGSEAAGRLEFSEHAQKPGAFRNAPPGIVIQPSVIDSSAAPNFSYSFGRPSVRGEGIW